MFLQIPITDINDNEVDVKFMFDILPEQKQTQDNPGYPMEIIDIEWNENLYSNAINDAILEDLDFVYAELLKKLESLKKER